MDAILWSVLDNTTRILSPRQSERPWLIQLLVVVLRALRERRGLSLRELGTLAETDYAYISKIERGDKEVPPQETFARLSRHLKPTPHELRLLKFLYTTPDIDPALALHALTDQEATPELLTIAASAVFRGTVGPSPQELIQRAKRAKRIMDGSD